MTGWQPDPFGVHEFRLFSPEGNPTAHVRTEGRHSYDEMPGAVMVDPPRAGPRQRHHPRTAAVQDEGSTTGSEPERLSLRT